MNDFDYAVAYQKIESAKLVYQLEELIRNYSISYSTIYHTAEYKQILFAINHYKALTFALQCFNTKSRKSLPDFVDNSVRNFEKHITALIIDQPITYEQFIDAFQFKSGTIQCEAIYMVGYDILKACALIVGSNPQPYTFNWAYSSNPLYRELMPDSATSRIIELEHFKQQNQLVNNTVVELELAELYSSIKPDLTKVSEADDFVCQIHTVYGTIKSKLQLSQVNEHN